MNRILLAFVAAASTLWPAATVQTTVLGPVEALPTITHDSAGNLLFVTRTQNCSVLDVSCSTLSVVKTDPEGRVLFRRALGAQPQRFTIGPGAMGTAIDGRGNVVIAMTTSDPTLVTVQPIQASLRGDSDIFIWKLSPDGERILFASYLGGTANDFLFSLALDPAGDAILTALGSSGFPGASPNSGMLNAPFQPLVVKVNLTMPRVQFAVDAPAVSLPPVIVSADGTAQFVIIQPSPSPTQPGTVVFRVSPDGRTSRVPTGLPAEAVPTHLLPIPGGGYWFAGMTGGPRLPTTENALQREPGTRSYYRLEDRQLVSPDSIRGASIRMMMADPADLRRIFATTSNGLMRSDDNGWTWRLLQDQVGFRLATGLAVGGGRVWLSAPPINGPPQFQVSDDNGESFKPVAAPSAVIGPIVAHPRDPNVLYAGTINGVVATRNGGETWLVRNMGEAVRLVAVNPEDAMHVIVQTWPVSPSPNAEPQVRQSRDGGETFGQSLAGAAETFFFDPFEAGTIYLKMSGLLRRTTADTFPDFTVIPGEPILQFVPHLGSPGVFFSMGALGGGIRRSTDRGVTWEQWSEALPFVPGQFVVGDGGVLHLSTIAAGADIFIAKSEADGTLSYLSYLGGAGNDTLQRIFFDGSQQLVIAGTTDSADFPLTEDPLRGSTDTIFVPPIQVPNADFFVTRLFADGSLASSIRIGGPLPDQLVYATQGPAGSTLLAGIAQAGFPGTGEGAAQFFAAFVIARLTP